MKKVKMLKATYVDGKAYAAGEIVETANFNLLVGAGAATLDVEIDVKADIKRPTPTAKRKSKALSSGDLHAR